MHSLINIVPRKHSDGKPYFQARFFDKGGRLIESVSFPKIQSHAEAYLCAREKLEPILTPFMPKEEIKGYGILSLDEVRSIQSLKDEKPNEARNTLIALLGITCGLGVSEIRNLTRDQITPKDKFLVENTDGNRVIPFIYNVKKRLENLKNIYPDSRYVIPNLNDMNKPCDPISIKRGVSSVLSKIGIGRERNIVPCVLRETFITLLVSSYDKKIEMRTIDYLCGFDKSNTGLSNTNVIEDRTILAIQGLMMFLDNSKFWTLPSGLNWG